MPFKWIRCPCVGIGSDLNWFSNAKMNSATNNGCQRHCLIIVGIIRNNSKIYYTQSALSLSHIFLE